MKTAGNDSLKSRWTLMDLAGGKVTLPAAGWGRHPRSRGSSTQRTLSYAPYQPLLYGDMNSLLVKRFLLLG